jgi:hypothetical protein
MVLQVMTSFSQKCLSQKCLAAAGHWQGLNAITHLGGAVDRV